MISWPRGKRASDGVWASHWYHSVEASTGFAKSQDLPKAPALSKEQKKVVDEVQGYYEALKVISLN